MTDRRTFQRVDQWLHEIQQYAELHVNIVLVGTKADLENQRSVLKEEGVALAEAHGIAFFEVSAKGNLNVTAPFDHLAKRVYERLQKTGFPSNAKKITVDVTPGSQQPAAGTCC